MILRQKDSRLPERFWRTVNRPTRKTGTGALLPCPTHTEVMNSSPSVVASKAATIAHNRLTRKRPLVMLLPQNESSPVTPVKPNDSCGATHAGSTPSCAPMRERTRPQYRPSSREVQP
jgi:hypothetical protein